MQPTYTQWYLQQRADAISDLRKRGVRTELSAINDRILRIMQYLQTAPPPEVMRRSRVLFSSFEEEFHRVFKGPSRS